MAVTALVLSLVLPAAGLAGKDKSGNPADVIDATLLAQAQTSPKQMFAVVVQGADGSTAAQLAADVSSYKSANVTDEYDDLDSIAANLNGKDLVKLGGDSLVAGVTADVPLQTQSYQNDEIWRQSSGLSPLYSQPPTTCAPKQKGCVAAAAVMAPRAPAIAIVDSGIDSSKVADFGSRIEASVNFVSSEPGVTGDPLGHGTMVAGIAAGAAPNHVGASPSSPLVDVRVADSQGQAQTSDVIAGLDWILQNKDQLNIRVVNISLGSSASSTVAFDPLDQAVEQLWLDGLVVVVAAGNNGQKDAPVPIGSPANDPFVITVGALDEHQSAGTSDDFRAPWSSYGTTDDGFAKPDISAPGRYMVAPVPAGSLLTQEHPDRCPGGSKTLIDNGYMWMSGTSFAAPVVAGAAAQVLALHPNWTPNQVKGALMDTASPNKGSGVGAGEVNAAAAANDASPGDPNAGLSAWVTTDPTTGQTYFDANAWHDAATATTSNWVRSNWVRSAGVSSNWVRSNWVRSNWVASNWVRSNWVATAWVESSGVE